MKHLRILCAAVILFAMTITATAYSQKTKDSNKAGIGKWASNGRIGIKVNKIETFTSLEGLGKLMRVGKKEEEMLSSWKKALESGGYKIIVVHLEMRNDFNTQVNAGWHIIDDERGYLYLRGEEGTEKRSSNTMSFGSSSNPTQAGTGMTYYLSGGLPENALIAPKAIIKGKVVFVVDDWYVPAKLFTKPSGDGWNFGKTDLIITLK